MDMKIIYTLSITIGIILIVFGAYFAGYDYRKKENQQPEPAPQSTWLMHYNEHQAKLDPLETEFDSLHKVWRGYYNELNFEKMKETNETMKLIAEQMHILLEKYKATRKD